MAANTGSLEGIAGVGYAGVRVVPVTVLDANSGSLVFSSYWDAITKTTKEQAIGGGYLQVH